MHVRLLAAGETYVRAEACVARRLMRISEHFGASKVFSALHPLRCSQVALAMVHH